MGIDITNLISMEAILVNANLSSYNPLLNLLIKTFPCMVPGTLEIWGHIVKFQVSNHLRVVLYPMLYGHIVNGMHDQEMSRHFLAKECNTSVSLIMISTIFSSLVCDHTGHNTGSIVKVETVLID